LAYIGIVSASSVGHINARQVPGTCRIHCRQDRQTRHPAGHTSLQHGRWLTLLTEREKKGSICGSRNGDSFERKKLSGFLILLKLGDIYQGNPELL
jgi:hypothetical protein